eukprot:5078039-Alexandrium_andersonii.AAC.1
MRKVLCAAVLVSHCRAGRVAAEPACDCACCQVSARQPAMQAPGLSLMCSPAPDSEAQWNCAEECLTGGGAFAQAEAG